MLITVIGFITGILIGLTGTGGGVLLTPLLMVLTPYPAVTLIGTDIVNGAFTKLLGVFEHRRLGQVRWRLATFLIIGTVPGTIGGILLLSFLKSQVGGSRTGPFPSPGAGSNAVLRRLPVAARPAGKDQASQDLA